MSHTALYTRETGFRDDRREPEPVEILGVVYGEYEPGYMASGSKRSVLAIVAGADGHIFPAELRHLRYRHAKSEADQ
jgi:hypothetical protein